MTRQNRRIQPALRRWPKSGLPVALGPWLRLVVAVARRGWRSPRFKGDRSFSGPATMGGMRAGGKLRKEPAHGMQDIDGGVVRGRGQPAGKDDVAIQDGAAGIANRLVEIVALHQNREEAGDRALLKPPGALQDFRKEIEDRGRVSFLAGRLAGRQADLPLGHGQARDGVHDEKDTAQMSVTI